MASLVFGAIGSAIGSSIGGTFLGIAAKSWGGMIGSYIGNAFFAPGLPTIQQEGPRLSDLTITASSYGMPIPEIFGSARVSGNLIWADDIRETVHTTTQEVGGGKGGGGSSQTVTTTTYTYSCAFAVAICKGPIQGIRRIWADNQIIYNMGEDSDDATQNASRRLASSLAIYKGTNTQTPDPTIQAKEGLDNTPAFTNTCYIVFNNFSLGDYGNRIPSISIEVVQHGHFDGDLIVRDPVSLASVITTLSQRAGLSAAEIDVSDLSQDVDGCILNQESYRDALEHLMKAYFITAVLSGGKIKFKPTDTESRITIQISELGAGENEEEADVLLITRQKETDLPKSVQISYLDRDRDYLVGTQIAQRAFGHALNVVDNKYNVVMTADAAAQIAEKSLYEAWISRLKYQFSLGSRYLFLDPGDVITIVTDSATHVIQLTRCDIGVNGVINCTGIAYDAAVYSSIQSGSTGQKTSANIVLPGLTTAHFADLPPLSDTHNSAGFYAMCSGELTAWRRAVAYRSVDGGLSYIPYFAVPVFCVLGSSNTLLPAGKHTVWDNENTVDVTILKGDLESKTDEAVLVGANAALLGDEIIQFANATLIGDKQYRLSRLLRGRRGTEWAINTHVAGERFTLLADSVRVEIPMAEIGSTKEYKVVAAGGYLSDEDSFTFATSGESLRPFSPVHLQGIRDGEGNLQISWVRRGRIGRELMSGTDIPLSEQFERYEVEFMRDSITVARVSQLSDVTTTIYTIVDQIADFGYVPASIIVKVYQLSAAVGRGRPAVAQL